MVLKNTGVWVGGALLFCSASSYAQAGGIFHPCTTVFHVANYTGKPIESIELIGPCARYSGLYFLNPEASFRYDAQRGMCGCPDGSWELKIYGFPPDKYWPVSVTHKFDVLKIVSQWPAVVTITIFGYTRDEIDIKIKYKNN